MFCEDIFSTNAKYDYNVINYHFIYNILQLETE